MSRRTITASPQRSGWAATGSSAPSGRTATNPSGPDAAAAAAAMSMRQAAAVPAARRRSRSQPERDCGRCRDRAARRPGRAGPGGPSGRKRGDRRCGLPARAEAGIEEPAPAQPPGGGGVVRRNAPTAGARDAPRSARARRGRAGFRARTRAGSARCRYPRCAAAGDRPTGGARSALRSAE